MSFIQKPLLTTAVLALLACQPAWAEDLKIGVKSEPTSLDPQFHVLAPNMQVSLAIFEALTAQDAQGGVQPMLAESWSLASPTEWDFKLRPGVSFSDGTPLTADDVVYTFGRVDKVPNSPSSFTLFTRKIAKVEALDPGTVRITTSEPYPLLLVDIVNLPILSKAAASGPAPEGRTTTEMNRGEGLIGTGPYTFVSWEKGADLILERNEIYWGDRPAWDRVIMQPMTNPAARSAALLAGDIDIMESLPTASLAEFRANPAVKVVSGPPARSIYIALDQDRDDSPGLGGTEGRNPLKDRRVRAALSLAIDRAGIADKIMGGAAVTAGSLGTSAMFGTSPDHVDADAADPARAKALLEEAGWGKGFSITIGTPNGRYVNDARVTQTVAAMWSRIGVQTKVDAVAPPVYFKNRDARNYSAYLGSWGNNTAEIGTTLTAQLATYDPDRGQGTSNNGRYANPDLDALLSKASGTMDDAARASLLQEADALAMEDYAILPLYFEVPYWALRPGLDFAARADQFTLPQDVTPAP
jgi:peptide/nickel transport system substrate-binding protein